MKTIIIYRQKSGENAFEELLPLKGKYVEVVKYLLEHGAVEGVEGETELTPKDREKRFKNPEMVAAFDGAKGLFSGPTSENKGGRNK